LYGLNPPDKYEIPKEREPEPFPVKEFNRFAFF
jgi:hypothetical protein